MSPLAFPHRLSTQRRATATTVLAAQVKLERRFLVFLSANLCLLVNAVVFLILASDIAYLRVVDLIKCLNFHLWRRAGCVYWCWGVARYWQRYCCLSL